MMISGGEVPLGGKDHVKISEHWRSVVWDFTLHPYSPMGRTVLPQDSGALIS